MQLTCLDYGVHTFFYKTKIEKEKEKKEKVGAESGHEDNFPGLIKICMVREN